jgi:hypothetical protein
LVVKAERSARRNKLSKISIQGAATGTGVFTLASPATNTDRVLTLPDEAGTVLTTASTTVLPKGVPVFKVHKVNATQSVTVNTWSKITWDTASYEENCSFDFTNNRIILPVAGYYLITTGIAMYAAGVNQLALQIYKNGSLVTTICNRYLAEGGNATGSDIVYFNGTSDYLEIYGYIGGSSAGVFYPSIYNSYFSGAFLGAA